MAGVLGAFGLTGCTGVLDRSDDEQGAFPDSPPDGPERPPAWYRQWLPSEHPPWIAADLELVRDHGDDVPSEHRFSALSNGRAIDYHGVPLEAIDGTIQFLRNGLPTVFVGDVDRNAVADTLTGTRYEPGDSHASFQFYQRDDQRAMVAVGAGALVATRHAPRTPDRDPEALSDTRRFVEELVDRAAPDGTDGAKPSREATAVAEQFGSWPVVGGVRSGTIDLGRDPSQEGHRIADPIEGVEATLLGVAYGGRDGWGFTARCFHLHERVGAEVRRRLRRHAREEVEDGDRPGTETWIWRRDTVVEILAGAPLEEYSAHDSDGSIDVVPQVSVAFEFDAETEALSIRHLAGDPLPLDRTVLDGDVELRDPLEGTLHPGDSVDLSVEVPELPTEVRLVFESRSSQQARIVASTLLDP